MEKVFDKILQGYQVFRAKYAHGDFAGLQLLHDGQQPEVMVVACCDSRVDPAVILQCNPGDLFAVRNVANIVPPYEKDESYHGTSAALEFGICGLNVKHLILLGHSRCGGIQKLLQIRDSGVIDKNDFIDNWVSIINLPKDEPDVDCCAQLALKQSRDNCMTFPWIAERVNQDTLIIHLWFFDIKMGQIFSYNDKTDEFAPLEVPVVT